MATTFPTLDQVRSVYSGIYGKCCCGCAGKHSYRSDLREEASKNRGYPVQDDEVSDLAVKRIYNKIRRAYEANEKIDFDSEYIAWVDFSRSETGRLYIAYLRS